MIVQSINSQISINKIIFSAKQHRFFVNKQKMKKSHKYNLLSKDQPLKQKDQKEWIEMESVNKWPHNEGLNNDTSYMKFEEEYSEIDDREHLPLNKSNLNSSYGAKVGNIGQSSYSKMQQQNSLKNSASYNLQSSKAPQQPQQKLNPSSSQFRQSNLQPASNSQRNFQQSQIPQNHIQSQYAGMGPQYRPQQSMYNSMYQQRNNVSVYGVNNMNVRNSMNGGMYSQYQLYGPTTTNQSMLYRQSQVNIPAYIQQPQPTSSQVPQPSSIATTSTMRSTMRQSIPQMTVNCDKCTFTQSVPGNAQMYICCMCNEIIECFPLYGVFTCGICMAKVIYPYGTSSLIKCTKCLTVNRVNPQPRKKDEENVVLGKEGACEEEIVANTNGQEKQESYDRRSQGNEEKMRRSDPDEDHHLQKRAQNMKKTEQPFKVLPAQKKVPSKQEESSPSSNPYPQVEPYNQQKRQAPEANKSFNEELIQVDQRQKSGDENLHKQIFQLSQKLDQSLVISKQDKIDDSKTQIARKAQQNRLKQLPQKNLDSYPSIFD